MGAKKNNKTKNKTNNKKKTPKKVNNKKTNKTKKVVSVTKTSKDNNLKKVIKVEDLKKKKKPKKRKNTKSNAKKIASSKKKNNNLKKIKKILRKIRIYGIQSVLPLKNVLLLGGALLACILLIAFVKVIINKVTYLDLDLIPEKIDQLQTLSFSIDDAEDIINSSNAYPKDQNGRLLSNFKLYDEYDFEKTFKLDKSLVKEHYIRFNKMNGNTFVVIKATEGNKDRVKEIFTAFFKSMNDTIYEYLDYQDYQIFINSMKNPDVISKIRQSQTRVFNILQVVKKSDIESALGIKDNLYKKALVKISMLKTDTCEYIIIKPKNNKAKKKIMNIMNNHYRQLEEKWKDKDKVNYNLIVNRHFEDYHGYLIYVVSHDNDLAMELIKS